MFEFIKAVERMFEELFSSFSGPKRLDDWLNEKAAELEDSARFTGL